MKNLIVILSLIVASINNSYSQETKEKEDCNCNLKKVVNQYLENNSTSKDSTEISTDGLEAITKMGKAVSEDKPVSKEKVQWIVDRFCAEINATAFRGFSPERFRNVIFEGLKIHKDASNKKKVVENFLNNYKNDLICDKDETEGTPRKKHFFKHALRLGVFEMFNEFLLNDDVYTLDFDAYEMVDGKKETVLDYIDKLMASEKYDNEELAVVKDHIEDIIIEAGENPEKPPYKH